MMQKNIIVCYGIIFAKQSAIADMIQTDFLIFLIRRKIVSTKRSEKLFYKNRTRDLRLDPI